MVEGQCMYSRTIESVVKISITNWYSKLAISVIVLCVEGGARQIHLGMLA